MTDQKIRLITGSLLHDIGKVIYRQGDDRRNHSIAGYDYLKTEAGVEDQEILDCVRFHHASALRTAQIEENSLAYIVYIADNIAAAADRRKRGETDDFGFELSVPLQSVFNILNGNQEEMYYQPGDLNPDGSMNYPSAEKKKFSEEYYTKIKSRISENMRYVDELNEEYLNSLLMVLEANLTYIPSSTSKSELTDISLYDHMKLTAAAASCIYDYLNEKQWSYKETLFTKEKAFYQEKAFLLCSMDISGIQKFIYTIPSKNALRTLRARSFYLEVMMEHLADLLLGELELTRANLLYTGGGHCYLLLPNTREAIKRLHGFQNRMKQWFLDYYKTDLFVAFGYAQCDANALKNEPEGSYADIFHTISRMLSEEKMHRYSSEDIIRLNRRKAEDYSRECKVCKTIGEVDEEGVCFLCRQIETFSKHVLYSEFFSVIQKGGITEGLPLPGGFLLLPDDERTLKQRMESDPLFVRAYAKNQMYTGKHAATKLWTGDYTTGSTFEEFALAAKGINRIGVLRADVDNLGQAFVSGFDNAKNKNSYVTLSRTATLSRQLSMFFKYFINMLLENGEYSISGLPMKTKRKATIIYSGGDDVFIVGAWDDVIELAIDLRKSFKKYTQGMLSISAGIGIFEKTYPVTAIARETGEMETESKRLPGKNAVTLFMDENVHVIPGTQEKMISDGTCSWDELEEEVIGEKYRALQEFFQKAEDRGITFLYRILELVRQQEDRINFARLVYLLARLEPEGEEAKIHYRRFSDRLCHWIRSEKDLRQLKTAIMLYVYMHRNEEETKHAD